MQEGGLKGLVGLQLGDELMAPLDGPGDHLREKGVKGREGDQAAAGRGQPSVNVEDVAQGLEGVKGDTHRQNDLEEYRIGPQTRGLKERPGRLDEEAEIFEKSENGETEADAEDEEIAAPPVPAPDPQQLVGRKEQEPQGPG